ncbi:MAG: hypothetical protein WD065_10900 [Planctomycetaceae bacterium]
MTPQKIKPEKCEHFSGFFFVDQTVSAFRLTGISITRSVCVQVTPREAIRTQKIVSLFVIKQSGGGRSRSRFFGNRGRRRCFVGRRSFMRRGGVAAAIALLAARIGLTAAATTTTAGGTGFIDRTDQHHGGRQNNES